MSISAAPAYDSKHVANDFAAITAVNSVSTASMKSMESKAPAQIQRLNIQLVGADAQIDKAIAQVFDTHKKAVKTYGLANGERGKFSNIFNPPKEALLFGTAAVIPAFVPVASAIAVASVMNYINADRKSLGKQNNLRAILEDEMRASTYAPRDFMQVDWNNTGYTSAKPANDDKAIGLEVFETLAKPPEQHHNVQILLGSRARVDGVKSANRNRAVKGVPLSRDSVDVAKDMDLKRLHDPKILEFNLPGNHI